MYIPVHAVQECTAYSIPLWNILGIFCMLDRTLTPFSSSSLSENVLAMQWKHRYLRKT